MMDNRVFKNGDKVIVNDPVNHRKYRAEVVGHSRSGKSCWIVKDGYSKKSRESYGVCFLKKDNGKEECSSCIHNDPNEDDLPAGCDTCEAGSGFERR